MTKSLCNKIIPDRVGNYVLSGDSNEERIDILKTIVSNYDCLEDADSLCQEFVLRVAKNFDALPELQGENFLKENLSAICYLFHAGPKTYKSYLENISKFDFSHFKLSRHITPGQITLSDISGLKIERSLSHSAKALLTEAITSHVSLNNLPLSQIKEVSELIRDSYEFVERALQISGGIRGNISSVYLLFSQAYDPIRASAVHRDLNLFREYKVLNDKTALFDLLYEILQRGKVYRRDNQWVLSLDKAELMNVASEIAQEELHQIMDRRAILAGDSINNALVEALFDLVLEVNLLESFDSDSALFRLLVAYDSWFSKQTRISGYLKYPSGLSALKKSLGEEVNEMLHLIRSLNEL